MKIHKYVYTHSDSVQGTDYHISSYKCKYCGGTTALDSCQFLDMPGNMAKCEKSPKGGGLFGFLVGYDCLAEPGERLK